MKVFTWVGYLNSTVNPVLYAVGFLPDNNIDPMESLFWVIYYVTL